MITDQALPGKHSAGDVSPGIARKLISDFNEQTNFTVVDVSTPWEFAECHLEHAININFFSSSFKSRIDRLDKDHVYLLYCKIGGRSKMAQALMRKMGFENVYNLVGGTLLWEEEGLPLIKEGKKSIFSFCPFAFFVKSKRKLMRFLGRGNNPTACSDMETRCQCDGVTSDQVKTSRRWQDCCR